MIKSNERFLNYQSREVLVMRKSQACDSGVIGTFDILGENIFDVKAGLKTKAVLRGLEWVRIETFLRHSKVANMEN